MDSILINGGIELNGVVEVSGAKNAALPLLAASILTDQSIHYRRMPHLRDISTMISLLASQGADVCMQDGGDMMVNAANTTLPEARYELVKTMRASSLVLGPLLARFGRARVSLPGGCAIGARPIDLHLKGLEAMGALVHMEHGYVCATAPKGLHGTRIVFEKVTVTGTENLMMAACLAKGETILEFAAKEPEVVNLAEVLRSMGADIEGDGTDIIRINGVQSLHGCTAEIMPDRIEAASYLAAGIASGGKVEASGIQPQLLDSFLARLSDAGVDVSSTDNTITCHSNKRLQATHIQTSPYPGFPTDLQAQFLALMCCAEGSSMITETIFENRFMHVQELQRMGADIHLDGRTAVVRGVASLSGAPVMATDLRASACLVIAALAAQGETLISRVYHIDRGYERIEEKLGRLGARIQRVASQTKDQDV
ncbi:MAG: UDP-N-acetylglucosamine 1-carboxyvinyltransferase [Mariprofundales bacterium]